MSELSTTGRRVLEQKLEVVKSDVDTARWQLEKAQQDVAFWTQRLERDEARAIELSLDLAE